MDGSPARERDAPARIAELQVLLSALAYDITRPRSHELLVSMAGAPIDRAGVALLRVLADEREPLRIGRIAERLGVRAPHVTRQVRELERQGLVVRVEESADRRVQRVAPTGKGFDTLARLDRAAQALLAQNLEGVAADRIGHAIEVLRRISGARRQGELPGSGGRPYDGP
ncbi:MULTISPECIES: MarR family winged helix-turn-helix transcriptional regulator [unclassified Streptomyces]|uniref:MarR family winged helix-turn-helix transcriptional regulator n=1 Tax=unclassified Streptomyces TaxID=2593676 RepID=UPI00382791A0